jgi:ABC-type multidrug transport system fused ATPase/permease subunit
MRLAVLGALFSFFVAAGTVSSSSTDAALAGFAISFSLQFSAAISKFLSTSTSCELAFNSAERIHDYAHLKTEPQNGETPPEAWPSQGRVEVKDLVVGYDDGLPAVLQGLNLSVAPGERVGIVGRTGSGKSSLTLALFRFLEARQGSIVIDGIDISKVKLNDLRSRLRIIPQDPTIFSGKSDQQGYVGNSTLTKTRHPAFKP